PADANASFAGTDANGQAVSFDTSSANGERVLNVDAHFKYSCISGTTGAIHYTSGDLGSTINDATGYFGFTDDLAVSGLTHDAHFSFSGNFNTRFDANG